MVLPIQHTVPRHGPRSHGSRGIYERYISRASSFAIILMTHCSPVGGYSQGRASNSRFYWMRDLHNMEQRVAKLRDGPGGMDDVREFRAKRIVIVDQWMQVSASSTSFVTRLTVVCILSIRVLMHWTHGQPEAKRRPPECAGRMRTASITCLFGYLCMLCGCVLIFL